MSKCLDEAIGCAVQPAAESAEHAIDELSALLQNSGKPISMSLKRAAVRSVGSGDESLEQTAKRILRWEWQWVGTGIQTLQAKDPYHLWFVILCLLLVLFGAWRWRNSWYASLQRACSMASEKIWGTNAKPAHCRGFSSDTPSPGQLACPQHGKDYADYKEEVVLQSQSKFRCRMLTMAVIGTVALMFATVIVGRRIGSLALIGDGIHLGGDVATYGALLFAEVVSSTWQPDMESFSYGYGRLEVVFVFIALSGQYYAASVLVCSAVDRLQHPYQLADDSGIVIFSLGLASLLVNAGLGTWMHFNGVNCCHSAGVGGAAAACAKIHLMCDAFQNLIVIITGGLIWSVPQLSTLEPFCTLIFVCLLIYSTYGFWLMMLDILMERAPRSVDTMAIHDDLQKIEGVDDVHCLHVWALAPGKMAATVHLCTEDSESNEEVLKQARLILVDRYAIKHSTVQVSDSDDLM
mmetsp:Transcript_88116/g.161339  ORF Transcript_88116/g.161339 Transcript_88116/m.161339 type:complete len:464 (-) Transcript_88116:235-1626(-)